MSLNKRIIIALVLIVLIIPASYLFEKLSRENGVNTGKVINMEDNGKVVSLMGVDVVRTLKEQEFPGDVAAKGPTLQYVMGAAGISEFNNVEVKGLNGTSFKAGKSEVNGELLLFLTDRGTVNLCRKGNYQHFIIENVNEINKLN